jgi:adenosylmethionine-8-amino-7-oxononanoate aminotransferase
VGVVRYIGLFSTIELVEKRETKKSFPAEVKADVKMALMDCGQLTFIMVKDISIMIFIVPLLCIMKD